MSHERQINHLADCDLDLSCLSVQFGFFLLYFCFIQIFWVNFAFDRQRPKHGFLGFCWRGPENWGFYINYWNVEMLVSNPSNERCVGPLSRFFLSVFLPWLSLSPPPSRSLSPSLSPEFCYSLYFSLHRFLFFFWAVIKSCSKCTTRTHIENEIEIKKNNCIHNFISYWRNDCLTCLKCKMSSLHSS